MAHIVCLILMLAQHCCVPLEGAESARGKTESSSSRLKDLDATVNQALSTLNVPGAAIGVVVDGKVVLTRGYGLRDVAQGLPVTPSTLFCVGSLTKAFTALLIGQLVDQNVLAWDQPVVSILPEFRLSTQELTDRVTLRDLLAHRVGIPRHDTLWVCRDLKRADVLRLLPLLEPIYGLREKFLYNNFLYEVAGLVVERTHNIPWDEVLEEQLLLPLGMTSSGTSLNAFADKEEIALPYAELRDTLTQLPFRHLASIDAAGGLHSNVVDMTRWMQLQLGKQSLISAETLVETRTVQMALPTSKTSDCLVNHGYGFGWNIGQYRGNDCIGHSGHMTGYFADILLLPKKNIGVVVLSNSSSQGRIFNNAVTRTILDKLLGAKGNDWIAQGQQELQALRKATRLPLFEDIAPAHPLEWYAGCYDHPAYGHLHIALVDSQLFARLGRTRVLLHPKGNDTFVGVCEDLLTYGAPATVEYTFVADATDHVAELRVPFEAFRNAPAIIFERDH